MQRAGGGALGRRQLGDQRVERGRALLQPLVGGEQLEVRDLAGAAPGLDLADQLERAAEQRPVDALEHRLLGGAAAHHQVAVDPGVRLRRAAVELDQPLDRAVEVVGVEAVERLDRHRRGGEHLARELDVDRAVAGLGERVGDREVGDGGREEHRPVGLLRPEEADDVRRLLRVRQVAKQLLEPVGAAPVELADVEGAAAAEEDAARLQVVGAEVDERPDRALRAEERGDQRLVDAVLQRDDEAVRGEARRDRAEGVLGVLGLDGEQHGAEPVGQLVGRDRPRLDRELLDRALDAQAVRVDRRDVGGVGVAEEHAPAAAQELGSHGAADRAGADDHVVGQRAATGCSKVTTISCRARSRISRSARSAASPSPAWTAAWRWRCCSSEPRA